MSRLLLTLLSAAASTAILSAQGNRGGGGKCDGLPTDRELRNNFGQMFTVPNIIGGDSPVGGLFNGSRMWAAVVNRDGEICAATTSRLDPTEVWPGSQAIAKAKAFTANAFSVDSLPLSTARLYTLTQPGHSLASLGFSNPFNSAAVAAPGAPQTGQNQIAGGMIFFGGGVPLYDSKGKVIGGLGVSGDTACADHEVAKRLRHLSGLNPPAGPLADDITYSSPDGATAFTHPQCNNTYRNGAFLGNERIASGY
jgi:uncharacterized protein GlcG (DUF336 family)